MEPVQWPVPVLRFANSIAAAEGSLEAHPEWNNPGDMTISLGFPNQGSQNADGVLKFDELKDGWHVLYHQCWLMLSGKSHVYKLTDTLVEVGVEYANGDPNWAKNVAAGLGVPKWTTLGELAGTV